MWLDGIERSVRDITDRESGMQDGTVMTERERHSARITELEDEVDRIRGFIPELRRRLADDRATAPGDDDARRVALDARIAAVDEQIAVAKADATQRKREIDEWKLWQTGQTAAEDARTRLEHEIAWRAEAIADAERRIADLGAARRALVDERELARLTRPDESGTAPAEDRRVVAARDALAWAERELDAAREQIVLLDEVGR